MQVIFLGPPGVGKGTIAKRMQDRRPLVQISTGDLLRAEVKNGTELGRKAQGYMDAGELVPDEIVIAMLKNRIGQPDARQGFVLDGFPRTLPQAAALQQQGVDIDAVVNFTAARDTIIRRLSGRRTCRQCGAIYHLTNMPPRREGVCDVCQGPLYQRDDDRPEAIGNRLVVYEKQTAPLIAFYRKQGRLKDIKADDDCEQVLPRVLQALSEA